MSGIAIAVTIDDRQIREVLQRLLRRSGDLTPVMKAVGQTIRSSVVKNFEAGGRPERWVPTKPISLLIRRKILGGKPSRRRGPSLGGHKTLIESGRLMNSIAAQASAAEVAVGTNVVYGAIHQLGGKAGRGRKVTIPARPFLAIQEEDSVEIAEILVRHLRS